MKGTRADIRLVELGIAESREKARSLIMAGAVLHGTKRIDKPGATVPEDAQLTVKDGALPFVSRGGLKLNKALEKYNIALNDCVCLDVGASTGGFTDCMLQHGAQKVYAIDVGYGQLAWSLRSDPRVVAIERTNARNMEPAWFTETPTFAGVDVSFISIRLILPGLYASLGKEARAVVLVKPQFEAGREKVGKNGVVREATTHEAVLLTSAQEAQRLGFMVERLDFSPITGPKGNIEFLMMLKKSAGNDIKDGTTDLARMVGQVVREAHEALVPNDYA